MLFMISLFFIHYYYLSSYIELHFPKAALKFLEGVIYSFEEEAYCYRCLLHSYWVTYCARYCRYASKKEKHSHIMMSLSLLSRGIMKEQKFTKTIQYISLWVIFQVYCLKQYASIWQANNIINIFYFFVCFLLNVC